MIIRIVASAALLIGVVAMADEAADRAKLAGSWQLQDTAAKDVPSLWVIQDKGEGLRMSATQENHPAAAFECNTMGRECEFKDDGKSAKVLLYFSGPKLVQLETRGSDVVKRRFSASGDEMVVEIIPVVPPGKTETYRFKRMQTASSTAAVSSGSVQAAPQQK